MNEISSLVHLRALILNDNEISSICKLVLSRNPITEIGDSLSKLKNLSKISLSDCRIKAIGFSLKSCSDLKELRLANNEIQMIYLLHRLQITPVCSKIFCLCW
ncbi:unnamed protein product [Microthlaspi erraticum]|uniref:U2A'/phosphoprotein 32 family A C-terminal domain-containing protein n=1 Tax=Microthlaspi erraticum TaxID=1685480 RepID=A0A6D2I485_9BRAS|nr:unnamed protein product [Microthlaspi erraticum]